MEYGKHSISRRKFASTLAAASIFVSHGNNSAASEVCNSMRCDARIPTGQFRHILQPSGSVWCWAAALAMIFEWHGRNVTQSSIVQQTFGSVVNAPADPITLINSVNRSYIDNSGNLFHVSSDLFSSIHGFNNVNNDDIIDDLRNDFPLVVCNLSHMMVLIGVSYLPGTSMIDQAWVADPQLDHQVAPTLPRGFRYLYPPEMLPVPLGGQLAFLARIYIS